MVKAKYIIMLILVGFLLFVPNIVKGADVQTYKDDAQNIEWEYKLDDNENVIDLRCKTTSKTGKVTIPSKINGQTVISLSGYSYQYNGAFQGCAGISEVVIPNTITTIGTHAFDACTGLKSIVIPDSVTKIESYAFVNCSGLTSVTFSKNLTSIGNSAFEKCTGLKDLTIPNTVTVIGGSAFRNCSGLKKITLSNNLSKISDCTFQNCSGLTSVIIPDSVTTIEGDWSNIYGAFGDCKNLQKVLIPDTVASIGQGAFQGCSKLTIYGNDNMVSKEYAEEYKIPFDYIANWDKAGSGNDITAPTVEDIFVTYESVMSYSKDENKGMYIVPAQAKLVINVVFSEVVDGTTVPTLTIKFGNGQNIQITDGTVGGSKITYVYTVKSTDKGIMATVDYKGGNIKDAAGNTATLSCPALRIQYSIDGGDLIYANGTVTNPSNNVNNADTTNGGTNSGGSNNGSTTNVGTNNGGSSNSGTTSGGNKVGTTSGVDKTVATGTLPQTGIKIGLVILLISIVITGISSYVKTRKYKDI